MKAGRKWLLIILIVLIGYLVLAWGGVLPFYQCGSTMGPQGPVNWCRWARGGILG